MDYEKVQPGPAQFAGDPIAESKSLQQVRAASDKNLTGIRAPGCKIRSSRERSLAITKIQEAIMWLGMDLKAINEETPGAGGGIYVSRNLA